MICSSAANGKPKAQPGKRCTVGNKKGEIIERYLRGETAKEIAADYGVTDRAINNIARRAQCPYRRRRCD